MKIYHCKECFCYCCGGKGNCPFYQGRYDELDISEIEGKAQEGELLAELYLAVCRISGKRVSQNAHSGATELKKLAKKSALAKGFLSLCYFEGTGVFKNPKKAFELCEKVASETGCHRLEQKVYECYKDGIGTKQDLPKAEWWAKNAARHGNEELMLWVADTLVRGNSSEFLEAVKLYKTAEQLGIPQAKERVKDCYRSHIERIIGEERYNKAVKGKAVAQEEIGRFYLTDPYAFNPQKAAEWYHKASAQGNIAASLALGKLYIDGEYMPRDLGLAYWYLKQITGSEEAEELRRKIKQEELAHLGKDESFFTTPAERTRLALYYLNGEGTNKDLLRAKRLLQESEKSECIYAFEKLGEIYYFGLMGTSDYEKAFYYLSKAWEKGSRQAAGILAGCYYNGFGVQKNQTMALELLSKVFDVKPNETKKNWSVYYMWQGKDPVTKMRNGDYPNEMAFAANLFGVCLRMEAELAELQFACYEGAAKKGYGVSFYNLGWCYEHGHGTMKSQEQAIEYYQKGVERDIKQAQYALGVCYMEGNGVEKDEAEGLRLIKCAADKEYLPAIERLVDGYLNGMITLADIETTKGNAKAKSRLADRFYYGRGVEKDYAKALKLYQEAASQGDADAYNGLGNCYSYGYGTTKNDAEAVKWYEKAAQEGHAEAQASLGYLYYNGIGVPNSLIEAIKWFKISANQGNAIGCSNLGVCYYYGNGVIRDYAEAVKWLQKAADQNYLKAARLLGNCYYFGKGTQMNRAKAFPYFEAAAKQGVRDAKEKLAACYYEGNGTPINYGEALRWYKSAAADGDAVSMRNVGMCYEKGRGVTRNLYEAHDWYSKAIEKGFADAKKDLDRVKEALIQEFNHSVEKYKSTPETATYSTSSEYSSSSYTSSYTNLDYDSSTAFLNRCLRDDLAFSSSDRERELVRERYRYNYPDTVFYEDYPSSSYSEPLDDHDYLELLNDIM